MLGVGGESTIDVAVVGVGRMGRHHVRIYSQLPEARLVAVVDADAERAETLADEYGCAAYTSVEQLLEAQRGLTAASVAVPTQSHVDSARPLLERGIACLIEKPLAASVAEARKLADLARQHRCILQVGHTERFNPAIRALAELDITARFIEVDRVSPMTFRSLDIGVVMDMMIHDLDIVLMLARSTIARVDAVGVAVLSEHEDIASARILFESGCVANLTASRLALKTERKMRLFSDDAYSSIDYQKRSGVIVRRTARNVDALATVRAQLAAGEDLTDLDYAQLVQIEQLTMDQPSADDPLTAQLSSFLRVVRTGEAPVVDARAGWAAVEAAERVVAAIREHRWEGMSEPKLKV